MSSAGLMSAKALSRFENDENYPNSYMMQILFEQSRKIIKAFYFMLSKSNMNIICGAGTRLLKFFGEILYIMLLSGHKGKYIDKNYIGSFVLFGRFFWTII